MKITRSVLAGLLTGAMIASAWAGNTTQNFSANFPDPTQVPIADIKTAAGPGLPPAIVDGWDGKALRLTHDGQNSQNGGVAFNQLVSGPWDSIQFDLEFQITNAAGVEDPAGADGLGFVYAASSLHGANNSSPVPDFSEEANLAGSLGVGFDSWSNSDVDGTPNGTLPDSISLHWNGARVETKPMGTLGVANNWIENGNVKHATVRATGDGKVTVTVTDLDNGEVITPWTDFPVPGLAPYDGRVVFRSRTGGENANHDIDNILITQEVGGVPTTVTVANFEGLPDGPIPAPVIPPPALLEGTPYASELLGSNPGATLINQGPAPGPNIGYLQLTAETGSQQNRISFDQTSTATAKISTHFDFQIRDTGAADSADGMAFALVPAATYGTSGPLGAPFFNEEPNLAGALGVGFDTFDNDEEGEVFPDGCGFGGTCADRRANHVSLYWDGTEVGRAYLDRDQMDLVNNNWNNVLLEVEEVAGGAEVTLAITDGTDGSIHLLFDDQFVAGLNFPGGARAVFAGRTGGAADFHNIDNLSISYVPEPGAVAMLFLGALGLILSRRGRMA